MLSDSPESKQSLPRSVSQLLCSVAACPLGGKLQQCCAWLFVSLTCPGAKKSHAKKKSTLLGWVGWMGFCRANVFVLSFFSKIFCSSAYFLGVWICLVNSMLHVQMKSGSLASPQCRLLKGQTHTEQVDEPSPSIVHMQSLLLTALLGLLRLPAPATC